MRTEKSIQRQAGIAARKSLNPAAAAAYSKIISEKLIQYTVSHLAETILTYRPFNGEADISFFNETMLLRGACVAFPICFEEGRMSAAVPEDFDAWEIGKYGIKTPVASRSLILSPLELTLVIVPCAAFNGRSKSRVGMGAGYFDRYLPECKNAALIAAAFEVQHMDAACSDPWDFPMDGIVTEQSWY